MLQGSTLDKSTPNLDELYRDVILDHYRTPRGREPLEHIHARNEGMNPVCGDEVDVHLHMEEGKVRGVYAKCRGCSISTASASMMAETLPDLTDAEVLELVGKFRAFMQSQGIDPEDLPGDLDVMEGLQKFPVRIKCALLPWITMAEAMKAWQQGKEHPDDITNLEETD